MYKMLNKMIKDFNHNYAKNHAEVDSVDKISSGTMITIPCKVSGFLAESYGKFPKNDN